MKAEIEAGNKEGATPIQIMRRVSRELYGRAFPVDENGKPVLDGDGKPVVDLQMAKDAVVVADKLAPYVHAKLNAIDPPAPPPLDEQDENTSIEDARRVCFAIEIAARGQQKRGLPKPKK